MWPNSINKKTDQEPENVSDLELPAAPANGTHEPLTLEAQPLTAEEQPWDRATEEAWSEHSETAWALVYVIHRVRSTPLPPTLPPAQQRHFHKIIDMAAAMLEDWQRRERDQARQLALRGLITELTAELEEAGESQLDDHANGNGQGKHDLLLGRRMSIDELLADLPEDEGTAEAQPNQHQDDEEEQGTIEIPQDDQSNE
jgi:hypothetical protein